MTSIFGLLIAAVLVVFSAASLASDGGEPAPKPTYAEEVPIWPSDAKVVQDGLRILAREQWAITHPSFLRYSPKAPSSGSAVIVFPGGGYKALAIGPKSTIGFLGANVCKWLTDAGVTCFLLKYRVPNTGCHSDPVARRHVTPEIPMALQDAQRAISMVRYNASSYGLDPDKIGVLGFSAGGNLAVLASTAFNHRTYDPIDEVDLVSSRPDFAIPVYPGHMTMEHKNKLPKAIAAKELNTDITVSSGIPPTLLIHANDDQVDPVHYSLVYERELRNAGVDVTLLRYQNGGHAFGVKKQGTDSDRWTNDASRWLKTLGMM